MKVCKIWDADYPWDVRVEKVCNSLVESGHEVHLVCRNRHGRPVRESIDGMTVHRLPIYTSGSSAALGFPFFLSPVWLRAISSVLAAHAIDVILVRDLPMALAGALLGRRFGVRCAVDMAEHYPEMLEGYRELQKVGRAKRAANFVLRSSRGARAVERAVCNSVDRIFAVSDEIRTNLIARGAPAEKFELVHNTPRLREIPEPWFYGEVRGTPPVVARLFVSCTLATLPRRGAFLR